MAPDVIIRDSDNHSLEGKTGSTAEAVTIGKRCWIASRSVILKGVSLGDGCVVAAGSIVTRSFPPRTLIGGVPARVIRENVEWS
ncbi:acyltransferase [bacterium]|nr:acyltransferase [bacterium]